MGYSQLKKIFYFLWLLLFWGSSFQSKEVVGKLYPGMKIPPFSLSNLAGENETLSHLTTGKKLTALVFWTVWNEQSSKELKRLQTSYQHYQSKGFQVIAINVEDQTISRKQLKNITNYYKKMGFTFPVLIDQNLETFHKYSIIAIPTTFLINEKGTIVYRLAGYPFTGAEQLFSTIKDLMDPESGKISSDQAKSKMHDSKAIRYYQMSKILQENGDYASAIESLRKSINIDPDFLAPYNRLGILLYREGKQKEAIEIFKQALLRNPEDLPFLADYGNFLIQSGEAKKGLDIIGKVLKEDPTYSVGHYYLGLYFLKQGEKEEALKEARLAVKYNPLDFNSHRLLGSVYESQGGGKKALDSYKKAAGILEKRVKPQDFLLGLSF